MKKIKRKLKFFNFEQEGRHPLSWVEYALLLLVGFLLFLCSLYII